MIFNLLSQLASNPNIRIIVLSLNNGILSHKLQQLGIKTFIISEEKHIFPVILLKAKNLLKECSINIIHSHRYKENLLALFLSRILGVKTLITTIHGLSEAPHYGEKGKTLLHIKTRIDYFILKNFFTRIITVSHEMQKVLINQYGFNDNQVHIIHNGIKMLQHTQSVNQPIKKSSTQLFHIGSVGRLTPVKDFSFFLDIAAEIRKRREDVHFSILGDGPLGNELQNKCLELNLKDSVNFFESVINPLSFYQSLDIYLNTSNHEGLPMSILEAMVCGLPVIAPKVGGIPEIINDNENGILVDSRDPAVYAEKCIYLLNNQKLREDLANSANQTIGKYFSSDYMAESYLKLYELTCHAERGRRVSL